MPTTSARGNPCDSRTPQHVGHSGLVKTHTPLKEFILLLWRIKLRHRDRRGAELLPPVPAARHHGQRSHHNQRHDAELLHDLSVHPRPVQVQCRPDPAVPVGHALLPCHGHVLRNLHPLCRPQRPRRPVVCGRRQDPPWRIWWLQGHHQSRVRERHRPHRRDCLLHGERGADAPHLDLWHGGRSGLDEPVGCPQPPAGLLQQPGSSVVVCPHARLHGHSRHGHGALHGHEADGGSHHAQRPDV